MTIREQALQELVVELTSRSLAFERVERSELLSRVLKRLPDTQLFSLYYDTFGKKIGEVEEKNSVCEAPEAL